MQVCFPSLLPSGMTLQFSTIASVLLKLFITLCTPLILFSGIILFDANDLYIWYMMHYKSLFAAVASFISIIALYFLALPVALAGLDPSPQLHEVYEPVRDHSTEEDRAIRTLLALAIKQQTEPKKNKEEARDQDKSSSYITQLEGLRKLQGMNAISNEEFEHLKSIILENMVRNLNDDRY